MRGGSEIVYALASEGDAGDTEHVLVDMDVNSSAPDASVSLIGGSRAMLSLRQDIDRAAR